MQSHVVWKELITRIDFLLSKVYAEAQTELAKVEKDQNTLVGAFKGDIEKLTRTGFELEDMQSRLVDFNPQDIANEIERAQLAIQKKEDTLRETNPKIQALNAELASQVITTTSQ